MMAEREITDVREMRKAITEMSYTGNSILEGPGQYSMAAVLARHCRDAAQHQGLSGEDAMTLLAYHALLSLEKANKSLLDYALCTPDSMVRAAASIGRASPAVGGGNHGA